ncbi:MAG: CHAT domain-containing protein [Acidobacteria bacterium]|nr:CHAT domain-containing protein [Acidobacteriota bacterium]
MKLCWRGIRSSHKYPSFSKGVIMAYCSKSRSVLSGRESLWARLNSYLMILVLFLFSCPAVNPQTSSVTNPIKENGVVGGSLQEQSDARTLEPGKTFEREIKPGERHSYLLRCEAGQLTEINVEYSGTNVGVALFGVDGQLILNVNNVDDAEGSKQLSVLADVSGVYRLDVRPLGRRLEPGRYEMNVSQPRAATQQDRDYAAAEKLLLEAGRFVGQGTGQSKRNAIGKYREALSLLRSTGNREREANVLNNIGFFYRTLGELDDALDFFNQALALRREIGDPRGEAISLNHLGRIHVALGEIQKGLDFYEQALALERASGSGRAEANTLSNIGSVYYDLGETERALDFYNRSLPLYRAVGGRPREALTLTSIGAIYFSRGENEKALEFYERALAVQQKLNGRSGIAQTRLQIGLLYAKLGNKEKAFDYLNQALDFGRKIGNRYTEAEALTVIGEVYYNAGEKQKALEHFNQALPPRQASGDLQGEARTLYWIARSERDRGQLASALKGIEATLQIVENVRGRINSQELRVSYFSTVQKYYDFYINLLFELHLRNSAAGYDEAALRASERARARSLLELLREARADIRRGVDPALLERGQSLQRQLNARAEEQLLLLSGDETSEQARTLAGELNALTNEYDEVQTRIRKTSPRYAALTQPQPLTLKEIQQTLDKETVLLEYRLGEMRSFVWAVTPTTINIYELPGRAEVEKLARRFYQLLTARNQHPPGEDMAQRRVRLAQAEAEYATTATQMSRLLLTPVSSHLKTQRLLIVSDGALQYVPFAALPKPKNEGSRFKGDKEATATSPTALQSPSLIAQPLIADHEIISLPSASVIAVLRKELSGRRAAPKTIAVLADPVFDKDDARVKLREGTRQQNESAAATPSRGKTGGVPPGVILTPAVASNRVAAPGKGGLSLPRLSFSRREAEAILAAVPAGEGMSALNFQASRATALSPELAQYRILHFATHGLLDSQRPELSALVLSLVDEQGQPQNGFIRLNEIYNLNLPADLVMLSACQTGLGKEIRGEGLIGLTRGFMYAGASRVGTSLWKVDDSATATLMGSFYQAMLKEGKSPGAALRAAQLEMLKQKRWQSPYYWAAFTMQGEWK